MHSVSAFNLSMVRQSLLVESFILFWASQCSMSLAGTPSMARMTSPGHRLAMEALLPGVIWERVTEEPSPLDLKVLWNILYRYVSYWQNFWGKMAFIYYLLTVISWGLMCSMNKEENSNKASFYIWLSVSNFHIINWILYTYIYLKTTKHCILQG